MKISIRAAAPQSSPLKMAVRMRRIVRLFLALYGSHHEWQIHMPIFTKNIPEDTIRDIWVMRRKVSGKWQYRAPTDDEIMDNDARRGW